VNDALGSDGLAAAQFESFEQKTPVSPPRGFAQGPEAGNASSEDNQICRRHDENPFSQ